MIVLFDDAIARNFEPFASSRPLGEVTAGAMLIRERWAHWFDASIDAVVSTPHLAHFTEFDAPPMATGLLRAGTWVVNSRALPALSFARSHRAHADTANTLRIGSDIAAIRLSEAIDAADLTNGVRSWNSLTASTVSGVTIEGVWLHHTWDIVRHLSAQLCDDIPFLAHLYDVSVCTSTAAPDHVHIVGDAPVYVEAHATIEPMTVFDTSAGPVLVRRGSTVQAFTRVVGPCYIGMNSTVTTDRIAASSIGDHCRVHGELSASVLIGHANKGHDGFVGHSILGRWVNLGAGTITSNLKNTYGTVSMWTPDGVRDTGLQFAGTFFGDHVKTGIGLKLTTGCVLGFGANVMDRMPPKAVAPLSWGSHAPYATFDAEKFIETASRMMARRQVSVTARHRRYIDSIIAHALSESRWPSR